MTHVSVQEMQFNTQTWVRRMLGGEEAIVQQDGVSVAKFTPRDGEQPRKRDVSKRIGFLEGQGSFKVDSMTLESALLDVLYSELNMTSEHGIATGKLSLMHGDPFDRILVALAMTEGILLATADRALARCNAPILYVV